ncbi:MAG TPA: aminotransferase class V-fold PLP-dependent enzyme [Thermomicrobiales bacterium]|nr:aminotransferase class V-fold PLP-dependent enzyme [Thermomicrobiales bacterium]
MTLDIERARRDTPGCERVLHFNNAGSSLPPSAVLDAQIGYLNLESQIGGYEAVDREHEQIEHVYDAAATMIGCSRDEIAIIENATRAWDMAFYSVPLGPGDRILTAKAEYASNFISCLQVAGRTGARVEVIPNDEHGQVSIEALQGMLDSDVKLISITHVPTNSGLVNPVAEIGVVAKQAGALYLVDACQSIGQMPVNVDDIGCDMLSTTGRKYLRGPRGTGFLYVRDSIVEQLEPPFLDLHAAQLTSADTYAVRTDARRFENWETNYAAKVGLAAALDYALDWGVESIWERVQLLASALRRRLIRIPGVAVHDRGEVTCGIVTFTVEAWHPVDVRRELTAQSINVTASGDSVKLQMEERGVTGLVRASVHYFNTEGEIERFARAIESLRA